MTSKAVTNQNRLLNVTLAHNRPYVCDKLNHGVTAATAAFPMSPQVRQNNPVFQIKVLRQINHAMRMVSHAMQQYDRPCTFIPGYQYRQIAIRPGHADSSVITQ
jgi:hypothetical protein